MKISESRYRCDICGESDLMGNEVKFLTDLPFPPQNKVLHLCWKCVDHLLKEKLEQDYLEELF